MLDLVNSSHGGQMINTRIESKLIKEDKSFFDGSFMHFFKFWRYIGCSDEITSDINTNFGNMVVKDSRYIADDYISNID